MMLADLREQFILLVNMPFEDLTNVRDVRLDCSEAARRALTVTDCRWLIIGHTMAPPKPETSAQRRPA